MPKTHKFLDVIEIKCPKIINIWDLVFHNKGFNFKLEIASEQRENKSRFAVFKIINDSYSPDFILWIFDQKEVRKYLEKFRRGAFIPYLPLSSFEGLKISPPGKSEQNLTAVNITVESEFWDLIKIYLWEYRNSLKQQNYLSASFMAWAICEAIVYRFLLDKGVKKKLLEKKMFGQLIEITEIMNLEIMNLEDFKKIKEYRNLIHPSNALENKRKIREIEREIARTFDRIVSNFGI